MHSEIIEPSFDSWQDALVELKRRAEIPWNEEPNIAPCTGWESCGRHYEVVEYDVSSRPWNEVRRQFVLTISAANIAWVKDAS